MYGGGFRPGIIDLRIGDLVRKRVERLGGYNLLAGVVVWSIYELRVNGWHVGVSIAIRRWR